MAAQPPPTTRKSMSPKCQCKEIDTDFGNCCMLTLDIHKVILHSMKYLLYVNLVIELQNMG